MNFVCFSCSRIPRCGSWIRALLVWLLVFAGLLCGAVACFVCSFMFSMLLCWCVIFVLFVLLVFVVLFVILG